MRKVVVSNATVIGTHFLAGFIVLVIVYRLIIKTIHRMRITARGGKSTAYIHEHYCAWCTI